MVNNIRYDPVNTGRIHLQINLQERINDTGYLKLKSLKKPILIRENTKSTCSLSPKANIISNVIDETTNNDNKISKIKE